MSEREKPAISNKQKKENDKEKGGRKRKQQHQNKNTKHRADVREKGRDWNKRSLPGKLTYR